MKAMIFAAGLGTRLRPLTDNMPKALVPIAGKPMLERVILRLKEAGFDDITVNIHHFGQQIVDFLQAHGNFGVDIHISDERNELLDTGGGIRQAMPYLDGKEPILIHNADILSDIDLKALYRHHQESNADATLLVSHRKTSRYLLLDDSLLLRGWINKQTGEVRPEGFDPHATELQEYAFGGIHVISPTLFRLMDEGSWTGKFSIIPFYLSVCRRIRIQGYPLQGFHWFDIGKPETLILAEAYCQNTEFLKE
ncbi:nucleotidyltransferase family protein [uncultured Bacteroides sp.]|uniref:nucleotidyltransferase family protein n=1 Tax=uncultured Bacteroides sp. TaxID=162156 RepID=UPI00261B4C07|nr:nucleotidyltransferase family protein [uncultured Bacteroides sp.]